jgi:micrococcal nuclease
MGPSYQYNAVIRRWVDADTVDLQIDLGFDTLVRVRCRLMGLNAPERFTEEGKAATSYISDICGVGSDVVVQTYKKGSTDKYGRWLATIFKGEVNINEQLIDSGHAVAKEY